MVWGIKHRFCDYYLRYVEGVGRICSHVVILATSRTAMVACEIVQRPDIVHVRIITGRLLNMRVLGSKNDAQLESSD